MAGADIFFPAGESIGGGTSIPPGVVLPYAAPAVSVPAGWVLCDGTAVSRTAYADLFSAISTQFGSGDGTTTFNVPDLRGRVPMGVNAARGLGASGGEETHQLSGAEMPSHTHQIQLSNGFDDPNHPTTILGTEGVLVAWFDDQGAVKSAGGDAPHNNLQPFLVLNYIIKA